MNWFFDLEKEEQIFIKNFIIASGSMKELSKHYEVSYPTIRARIDKIIDKIKITEHTSNSFDTFILNMVIDNEITLKSAKEIIKKHEEEEK